MYLKPQLNNRHQLNFAKDHPNMNSNGQTQLANLGNLSVQLKSLQGEQSQVDSKSSTPSTESSASSDNKRTNEQKNVNYSSIFRQNKQETGTVFQNASKNILQSNQTQSQRQLRTNSASPYLKNSTNLPSKSQQQKALPQRPVTKMYEDFTSHPFRHLVRGQTIARIKFFQYLDEIQSQLKFAKLFKPPGPAVLRNKLAKLSEPTQKPTLVLDMDETLIHSVFNPRFGKHSVQVNSQFQKYQQFFNIRPYTQELLKELSEIYEIIIFSASTKEYITAICHYLDPENKYISHILSRDNCYITPSGYLIKDLRVLSNRNLSRVIIVDNLALCFAFQIQNGIPIFAWLGDQKDDELKYLIDYLKELSNEENIAEKNFQNLKLNKLANMTKTQLYHYN